MEDAVLEHLERQQSLTNNQRKIVFAAILGDMLDFFDFYLIGFVLAFIVGSWQLTYGQSAMILLPAGLGAMLGAWMAPLVGWRGLFIIGLLPALLTLLIRAWVPESPRWLIGRGRIEEARRSVAWALEIDPSRIELPATVPAPRRTPWRELFRHPRSMALSTLTSLGIQT